MAAKTRFECRGFLKVAEEDVFDDGCQIDSGTQFIGDETWSTDTLEDLIDKLRAFVPFHVAPDDDAIELDACDEPGRIDIAGMETNDGDEPTHAQIEAWKLGRVRLWYVVYTFHVEKVTRETVALKTKKRG